jgi:hypothetical protein
MLPIPEITNLDIAFGNIRHMPKREDLPEEYRRDWHRDSQPFCKAVSSWFYDGAKSIPNGVEIDGVKFVAKTGVDAQKALAAIKAALGSFEPSHEHKIGGCGFMLSEWFDIEQKSKKKS